MKRFAALIDRLIYTRSRNTKLALIVDYLRHTPDPDRGWAIAALTESLASLKAEGVLVDADPEALAHLINGASSHAATWIASSADPGETSRKAVASFRKLLEGLQRRPPAA